MAIKFRLRGLAETFIEELTCPGCGRRGNDDQHFETNNTRVTFDGIIVVAECKRCGELFVPGAQRFGVLNTEELKQAVKQDSDDTGEPIFVGLEDVRLDVERLNALRKGEGLH